MENGFNNGTKKSISVGVTLAIIIGVIVIRYSIKGALRSASPSPTITYVNSPGSINRWKDKKTIKITNEDGVHLFCNFTSGQPFKDPCPYGVRWTYNRGTIPRDIPHNITTGKVLLSGLAFMKEIRTRLTLGPFLRPENTGIYTCECVNMARDLEMDRIVIVMPSVSKRTNKNGTDLSLICIFPPGNFYVNQATWKKDNRSLSSDLSLATSNKVSILDKLKIGNLGLSILTVYNSEADDAGVYSCKAERPFFRTEFQIKVYDWEEANGTLPSHLKKSSYQCSFSLSYEPTILWQFRSPNMLEANVSYYEATNLEAYDASESSTGGEFALTSYSYEGEDIEWIEGNKKLFTCRVNETKLKITMEMVTFAQETLLLCSFTEAPDTPSVVWKKNGVPVSTEQNSRYRMVNRRPSEVSNSTDLYEYDALFYIENPTENDSGNYSCMMETRTNETIAGKFFLNIEAENTVSQAYEGEATALECNSARTYTKSSIKWYKEGAPISDFIYKIYEGNRNDTFEDTSPGLFSSRLKGILPIVKRKNLFRSFLFFRDPQMRDTGNYSCDVSTYSGQKFSRKYHLTVLPHELF